MAQPSFVDCRFAAAFRLALLALLAGSGVSFAATITVDSAADNLIDDAFCTLREAIHAANNDVDFHGCAAGSGADRIVFDLTLPAQITLVADLPEIVTDLKISGPAADLLTIDGDQQFRPLFANHCCPNSWLGVEELTLAHGHATGGGAAWVGNGNTIWFRHVRFQSNQSTGQAGAVSASDVQLTFDECWLDDNRALGGAGGGALVASFGELLMRRTSVTFNRSEGEGASGGGLWLDRVTARIESSTITDNIATRTGGGIQFDFATNGGHELTILDSTVTRNIVGALGDPFARGGGIYQFSITDPGTLTLRNSIVALNLVGGPSPIGFDLLLEPTITVTSEGTNLVGRNDDAAAFFPAGLPNANGDYVGTAGMPIDPLLELLDDNGGFGRTSLPVLDGGSLVVDHGHCPATAGDQRGAGNSTTHLRPVDTVLPNGAGSDGCDIGATELDGALGADPHLFSDGFEAGHTLLWSSESP